jgi:CSLREA domain-containing protein
VGHLRFASIAVVVAALAVVLGALAGGGEPATGAQPQSTTEPCATCVWVGELTTDITTDSHREIHRPNRDTVNINHFEEKFIATELVFVLDEGTSAAAAGAGTYKLISGSLDFDFTGTTFSKKDAASSANSCNYDGAGTVDLQPGDAELIIADGQQGMTYTIIGNSAATTYPLNIFCNGAGDTVDYPLGEWFSIGDEPPPYSGGSVIEGSLLIDEDVNKSDGAQIDTSSAHGMNTWELSNVSVAVNTNDDSEDSDLDDNLCSTGGVVLVGDEYVPACSLRAAIQTANLSPDEKRITFDIRGATEIIVQVESLPALLGGVEIDGTTQPGAGQVKISSHTFLNSALTLNGEGNKIKGLTLTNFSVGINIVGGGENIIQENFIGVTVDGSREDNGTGISIVDSHDNLIGGETDSAANTIGANTTGILIDGAGSHDNTIANNFIGTNEAGQALGNLTGVSIADGEHNHIGIKGSGNLIVNSSFSGILIKGPAKNNSVEDNHIGVLEDGRIAPNVEDGVRIEDSKDNVIGADNPDWSNKIGGNKLSGIQIIGANAVGNSILGNLIGVNGFGEAIGNEKDGIVINGAPGTKIGVPESTAAGPQAAERTFSGNHISGNGRYGILLASPDTHGTVVLGNFLGISTGGDLVPNGDDNIHIEDSWENTIGSIELPNAIVGSKDDGIEVTGTNAYGNMIVGNEIGLGGGSVGETTVPNEGNGVNVNDAPHNFVLSNTIVDNNKSGVLITGENARDNEVTDNRIGIIERESSHEAAANLAGILIDGASHNLIGSPGGDVLGNTISGNGNSGISIKGTTRPAVANRIFGNVIGMTSDGTTAVANGGPGINLDPGAEQTIIGGSRDSGCSTPCNLISGNVHGIWVEGNDTQILGNVIGMKGAIECMSVLQPLAAYAGCDLGNDISGIHVEAGTGTRIGGAPKSGDCTMTCNLIAFNSDGVSVASNVRSVSVVGNSIFLNLEAIDLDPSGPTLNDEEENLDADTGANDLLNYPVIPRALDKETEVVIAAEVHSLANSRFIVDYYVNESCDRDEAQVYVGSASVQTDDDGFAPATRHLPLPQGQNWHYVSAFLVDEYGNTSEVSPCRDMRAVSSNLATDSEEGATSISVIGDDVPDAAVVHDQVQIGEGTDQETRTVVGVSAAPQGGLSTAGSGVILTLDTALTKAHAAAEPIIFIGGGGPGEDVMWADGDCNDTWSAADILAFLRQQAGISPSGGGACPGIGTAVEQGGQPLIWGDWDGDGSVDAADIVPLLRHHAGLPDETERWLPRLSAETRLLWES